MRLAYPLHKVQPSIFIGKLLNWNSSVDQLNTLAWLTALKLDKQKKEWSKINKVTDVGSGQEKHHLTRQRP